MTHSASQFSTVLLIFSLGSAAFAEDAFELDLTQIEWSVPDPDPSTAEFLIYASDDLMIQCRGCDDAPFFLVQYELRDGSPGLLPPLTMPAEPLAEQIFLGFCRQDYPQGNCTVERGTVFGGYPMIDVTASRPDEPDIDWYPTHYQLRYIDLGDTRMIIETGSRSALRSMLWSEHVTQILHQHIPAQTP